MSNQRYTPEFKDEAARQIVDRGSFCCRRFRTIRCIGTQSLQVGQGDKAG